MKNMIYAQVLRQSVKFPGEELFLLHCTAKELKATTNKIKINYYHILYFNNELL